MLTVEKALGIYTDKLNSNEKIDLTFFEKKLTEEDYKEFLELIEFVKLAKSTQTNNSFDKMFSKIDKFKNECYEEQLPNASGFRKNKGADAKEAMDNLEKLFKEEFGDDE